MPQIITALGQNPYLQSIRLVNCELDDVDIRPFALMLGQNHTLTHVDLTGNKFGSAGATALAIALGYKDETIKEGKKLTRNTTLKFLNLKDNHISNSGANSLADALKRNKKTSIWINLEGNERITEPLYIRTIMRSKQQVAAKANLIHDLTKPRHHDPRIWFLFSTLIMIIHCLTPGVVRTARGYPFIGSSRRENFIALGHIIMGFFGIPFLWFFCELVNENQANVEMAMHRIGALMSQRKALFLRETHNWNW